MSQQRRRKAGRRRAVSQAQPSMRPIVIIVLALIVLAIVGGRIASNRQPKEVSEQDMALFHRAMVQLRKVPDPIMLKKIPGTRRTITHEQAVAYYMETFGQAYAEICEHYPVESIRLQFVEAVGHIGQGRAIGIDANSQYDPVSRSGEFSVMAAPVKFNGVPTMVLYIPAWMDLEDQLLASMPGADAWEMMKDQIILGVLHEYYHLTKQSYWQIEELSPDQLADSESECWAYTCRELIQPMQKAGRARLTQSAAGYYEGQFILNALLLELGNDPRRPTWRHYIADNYIQSDRK
jgi:hypothetical protein